MPSAPAASGHRHSHQLPGRGGGVDALPARKGQRHSGRPCHPAPSRLDDCPFIHLQGKPVREAEVPLRADGRQRKGKAQNGLPGVPRRDSRGRVCRVPAVLPLRRAVPDAGIGRREENGKGMRIWTGASFVWARWILRPDRSYYWFFVIFLKMYTLSVEKSYYLCRSKSGNIKT